MSNSTIPQSPEKDSPVVGSPEKKIKLNSSVDSEQEVGSNQQKLPKLTDLMAPDELPPAAFSTTVPEITTVTTGEVTTTLPQHSQLIVPVLPECIPLIAEVPDVVPVTQTDQPVQHKKGETNENEEVLISQVLPGYAPSYASDYVPAEINTTTYNSFVNTLSFNISRYPTLTEITDSKNYIKKTEKSEEVKPSETNQKKVFDYVPAEYLTGQESSYIAKASNSMCAMVSPEVLSSGRVLTTMCVPVYQGDENNIEKSESSEADLEGSKIITKEDINTDGDDKILPTAAGDKQDQIKNDKSEKENSLEACSVNIKPVKSSPTEKETSSTTNR